MAPLWLAVMLAGCELAIKTSELEGGCPRHLPGPGLVKIPSSAGDYCIDATEVTNAHYQAFVESQAKIDMPAGCELVTTYTPAQVNWPVPGSQNTPVVRVSWCLAYAYCTWSGKRICGRIGGGALLKRDENDASVSQWYNACSGGGVRAFPYGQAYDPTICVGPPVATSPLDVAKLRGCEGGYPGLYDMSGNVWEWGDACDPPGGFCHAWGAAFDSAAGEFGCVQPRNWKQVDGAGNIGFRCCKDL